LDLKPPFKIRPPQRWVAVAGIALLSLIAVAGFSLAVYAAWLFHDLPDAAELADYHPPTATRVYAWDGTLIGEYSKERRIYVPYEQIPPRLTQAFLAAEDRNFFKHGGIDVSGLGRAMLKDMVNATRGRRFEGGSTITQQVAKNILLNNDATIGRKLKEAILAHRLEQRLTKERILELYLNEIWLGYRSYGVGAAAYNYFGKSLDQLTLEECAYLAALPKGPDNYQPVKRKAQAIARRNWIIDQMDGLHWVNHQDAMTAEAMDLKVNLAPIRSKYTYADFFVEEVRRRALTMSPFGKHLTEGGYYIRTTLDSTLQQEARDALMGGLESYDHRHGWRGAVENVPVEAGWDKEALTHHAPSERTTWRVALIETIQGSNVRVLPATGEAAGPLAPEDVAWAKAGKGGLKAGDVVFVEPADGGRYRLKQIPLVNGALVVIDPQSGRVMAMVGGYSYSLSNFNRATQANRQPGSAFKPFVYATALQNGFTPASVVVDGPITLKGAQGVDWTPENYEHDFLGPLVLRRGLELSRNTMTVRLAQAIGMKKIVDTAIRFGVVTDMQPVLAMALGAGETTPLRLTGAYSTFINGGRKIDPHLIELVEDRDGKTVFRADRRLCPRCKGGFTGEESPRLPPDGAEILDPVTAYQMTSFLQGVVQRGTAAAASSLGRPLGGKTGTTNEFRSAWFVGFSPDIVVGTFIGFDDNRSLGEHETGAVAALPVFMDFMKHALKDTPVHDFKPPSEAHFAMVNGIREAFRAGTEPRDDVSVLGDELKTAPDAIAAPGLTTPPPAPGPRQPPADLNGLF
jgi:penicillin-binding protein 1A